MEVKPETLTGVSVMFTSYNENGEPVPSAFRLCWDDDHGHHWTHSMGFARRKDADAALLAAAKAGCTFDDFLSMPEEGEWPFDRVMLEAMQW